jgi:methylmalonyl-CoA mutase C-terminal domain/subunit
VIYSGLHQTLEQIIQTATQEAVDVIGLSIMSGAHLPICDKLIRMMTEKKLTDIRLVVGGVIPYQDIPKLKEMGVAEVFPGGTSFADIIAGMNRLFE